MLHPAQDKVLVGMSAPLTGPNGSYGKALAEGVRAAIARANQTEGARIELMLLDDAGMVDKAIVNTRSLLDAKVVALTGYHGSAVVEALVPLLEAPNTPMIGAASSAESLRTPPRRWLFNLRAAAGEETAAMIYHLDTIGLERIAAIVQKDGLGQAGLEGIQVELVRIGARPVGAAEIEVRPTARELQDAVQKVCASEPQAIVLALNASNSLAAMRQAREQKCRAQFFLLSETGSDLASAGATPSDLAGVVVSQVLPSPMRPGHPLVFDYQQDLARV